MKRIAIVLVGTMALAACETTPSVTAADQFFGKELVAADGTTFIFNPDGTVGGSFRGEEVVGTFSADATEICSEYTAPDKLTGYEVCSVPAIDGDTVIFNRRDGSQSQPYMISG